MGDLGEASRRSSSGLAVTSPRPRRYLSSGMVRRDRGSTFVSQGLEFKGLCVDVEEKRILWDVSGKANHGRVLAVMGPSGSGKTTLLNALAGYTQLAEGTVTFNGLKLGKKLKRHISYVLQADVFFPNLTLKETLRYSAFLRLPREFNVREKLAKVEEIINTLHLSSCADTIMGSVLERGLSGGEKKRANIGCELLTNPSLLLLDEPTSGLDSTSALSLMETLCKLASQEHKIIVASIHQPSSQLYHMCHDLLLLAKGKVAYFGEASKALQYFSQRGLECTLHYNPADFMLEMVSMDESRKTLIGQDPVQNTRPVTRPWWRRCLCWHKSGQVEVSVDEERHIQEYPSSPHFPRRDSSVSTQLMVPRGNGYIETEVKEEDKESVGDVTSPVDPSLSRKWPTPWHWQLLVLTVRTFRQSRHVLLSKLNIVQTVLLAIVISLIWFQIPEEESSIRDRYGYLFFILIFWTFQPSLLATATLPAEHAVISKERQSGCYHLSAYYMAKTLSELPLVLFLPSIFYIISYWCSGLNGWTPFFVIWFVILVNALVSQGMGLMIGALFMNYQRSLVASTIIILSLMLLGGFYVDQLPQWLYWAQYASFVSFNYRALLELGFLGLNIRCGSSGMSEYSSCNFLSNDTAGSGTVFNATVTGAEVVRNDLFVFAWYNNVLITVAYGIVFRIVAYLSLRFLHK